jgi:hypothetical protein
LLTPQGLDGVRHVASPREAVSIVALQVLGVAG